MTGTNLRGRKFLSILLLVTFMLTTVVAAPVFAKVGTDIKVQVQQMVVNLADVDSVDVTLTSGTYEETVNLTMSGNQAVGHVTEDLSGQNVTVEVIIHWANGATTSIVYHTSAANAMLVIQPDGEKLTMPEGSITIVKALDGDTPPAAADFTFTVEGQEGTFTITGAGSTTIDNIPPGTYTVTELSLPDGYSIGDYDQEITVTEGETATATFTNTYTAPPVGTGSITITKAITGDTPASDATFTFTVEGRQTPVTIVGAGSTTVSGLAPDTYTITETNLPDDYTIETASQDVVVTADQTAEVTFTNVYDEPVVPPTTGNLTITKALTGDTPSAAADFTFTVEGQQGTFTITGAGSTTINNIPEGVYTVTEINLPDGYSIGDADQDVTIVAGQTATVTFTNTYTRPTIGSLTIVKALTGSTPPSAADFTFTVEGQQGTFTITGIGSTTINNIPEGIYTVTEINLPIGYSIGDNDQDVTIVGGDTATATFTNRYTAPAGPTTGDLTIIKDITGDTPGSAAIFTFDVEGQEAPITISGEGSQTIYGLAPGTYTVAEIDLPDYYSIEDADQEIVIVAGQTATATFTNTYTAPVQGTGSIRITKAITGDSPAYDATFTFEVEGQEVPVTIVGEGSYILSGLQPGTYTVTEVDLPYRYTISDASREVVVTEGELANVTFTNTYDRPSSSYSGGDETTPEVVIVETPAPESPIIVPAPIEVPEEVIIIEADAPLGELPKTGTSPMAAAPSQAPAYLPSEMELNFKDEDEEDDIA